MRHAREFSNKNYSLSSDCTLRTSITCINFVSSLSSSGGIMSMMRANSLDHWWQTGSGLWLLTTDVCDLVDNIQIDATTFSFIIVIEGLCTHQEHMIEQEGNLDMLGMLDFICFLKSCSILWCLAQKIHRAWFYKKKYGAGFIIFELQIF